MINRKNGIIAVIILAVGLLLVYSSLSKKGLREDPLPALALIDTPWIEAVGTWDGAIHVDVVASGPEAIRLTKSQVPPNVGDIATRGAMQYLTIGNKEVFSGKEIRRVVASGGNTIVCAVTGNAPSVARAEVSQSGILEASYHELWILRNGEAQRMLAPRRLDATNPMISMDGDKVIFLGRKVDKNGFLEEPSLYIASIGEKSCNSIELDGARHDMAYAPVAWDETATAFTVLTNSGEAGGNEQLQRISLKK